MTSCFVIFVTCDEVWYHEVPCGAMWSSCGVMCDVMLCDNYDADVMNYVLLNSVVRLNACNTCMYGNGTRIV